MPPQTRSEPMTAMTTTRMPVPAAARPAPPCRTSEHRHIRAGAASGIVIGLPQAAQGPVAGVLLGDGELLAAVGTGIGDGHSGLAQKSLICSPPLRVAIARICSGGTDFGNHLRMTIKKTAKLPPG